MVDDHIQGILFSQPRFIDLAIQPVQSLVERRRLSRLMDDVKPSRVAAMARQLRTMTSGKPRTPVLMLSRLDSITESRPKTKSISVRF